MSETKKRGSGLLVNLVVAVVSVAATLTVSNLLGDTGDSVDMSARVQELESENAALTQQVESLTSQVTQLQNYIVSISDPADPDASAALGEEYADKQAEAKRLFTEIQAAYGEFDREKLEELCPQLNKLLEYMDSADLQNYYLILEYMEQPSND